MHHLCPSGPVRHRVFLFQPSWLAPGPDTKRLSHLLIPVLGSLLSSGCQITLAEEGFDGPPNPSWAAAIRTTDFAVAWCSEMYPAEQIRGLQRFLTVVQDLEIPCVAGGGFFRVLEPRNLEILEQIEALVLDAGEIVLPRLLDALRAGVPLGDVRGIAFGHPGAVERTAPQKRGPLDPSWIEVLRQLPLKRYARPSPLIFENGDPALQIHAGSGCAKRCAFCFDEHNPIGVFPAAAVVESARIVVRQTDIRQLAIGELDFFHRLPRVLDVARGFLDAGLRLRWFALGSVGDVARLSDPDLRLLRASGCHRIELGSESGSDSQLEALGKRHRARDILEVTARLHGHDICSTHNLIFGCVDEQPRDRRATIRLATEIRKRDPAAQLHFRLYQVVPNTSHGERALQWTGPFPNTLESLATYRFDIRAGARCLPWLSLKDEATVRRLTTYLLPLAFGRPPSGPKGRVQAALRNLARIRTRSGIQVGVAAEERLYRAMVGDPLASTYVA